MTHSETLLNSHLIWESFREVRRFLRSCDLGVEFYPGEEKLQSMRAQLNDQGISDDRLKYNADGVLRFFDKEQPIEISFIETSGALTKATREKATFDHYRRMYGSLAVLKTVADMYSPGDLTIFQTLKIHFIHVHGEYCSRDSQKIRALC